MQVLSAAEKARMRRLGLTACALVMAGAVLALYGTFSVLPYTPVRLPFANELSTPVWFPQGWAFFTRDAREDDTLVFVREGGTWRNAAARPYFQARYLFGLDRGSKSQGIEMGILAQQATSAVPLPCKEAPTVCLEKAPVALTLQNPAPAHRTLCGEVGLVFQKPIPWAWSRSKRPIVMPSQVLKLEVRC